MAIPTDLEEFRLSPSGVLYVGQLDQWTVGVSQNTWVKCEECNHVKVVRFDKLQSSVSIANWGKQLKQFNKLLK
jgi:hypothetical protein